MSALLRLAAVLVAAVCAAPAANAGVTRVPAGPTSLKAFLLRVDEQRATSFPRTPSFAWTPVRGAVRYEFELATSQRFNEGSVIWTNVDPRTELAPDALPPQTTAPAQPAAPTPTTAAGVLSRLRVPAIGIDVALPWITGSPYALYARVRAVLPHGATLWSRPLGFNVRWSDVPRQLPTVPGLSRWTPVDGATSYEVVLYGARSVITTTTNVVDHRDFYTFHNTPQWTSPVHWRVRAVRTLYGTLPSGLPRVSFGPWSPIYASANPVFDATAGLSITTALSDVQSTAATRNTHQLTPAFAWTGGVSYLSGRFAPNIELWRVYVATDADCVNVVYQGATVGSPAWAPRTRPLELPHTAAELALARTTTLVHGEEGDALRYDGRAATPVEVAPVSESPGSAQAGGPRIDLWDNSWATGGYYWTVVPVVLEPLSSGTSFRYRDLESPQDACQAGRVMRFGKSGSPVVTATKVPFATGLSPTGRLISSRQARQSFHGTPLVAWRPAMGAQEYEVQWSRSAYPWRRSGTATTGGTSMLLPLTSGVWYYRVRGLNPNQPRPEMGWSVPTRIQVAKPVFRVVR